MTSCELGVTNDELRVGFTNDELRVSNDELSQKLVGQTLVPIQAGFLSDH